MPHTPPTSDSADDRPPSAAMREGGYLLPIWGLTSREIVRFVRQRSRLIGAFAQPVIFWFLFGVGLSGSFRMPGTENGSLSYQEYFLPGVAAMIVLFTSIFSAISVIQDRNEGFLQGVLVSPVPRLAVVLGKLTGGTLLAGVQALLFLILAWGLQTAGLLSTIQWDATPLRWIATTGVLLLTGLGMCALGYLFAWKLDSVQGFHAIMSVLLFPMWLLSGAFFPAAGSGWLKWIIAVNPLTYGVAAIRWAMYPADSVAVTGLPSLPVSLAVTVAFTAICIAADVWMTTHSRT
ncbi:MAG: ABC transporter permease [Maioricimonas sp. JB049]